MSKVLKPISSFWGAVTGAAIEKRNIARNASKIGGEPSAEELAERRALMAAQGRRPKEEELLRMRESGLRPLQGGSSTSSFWT